MGFFDSVYRGLARFFDPLSEEEMKQVLGGRQQSDLAGHYFGQIYPPSFRDWTEGLLLVFNDGSGTVFWQGPLAIGQTVRQFSHEESWGPGQATNQTNDPTPLLVGPFGMPFETAQKRYLPKSLTSQAFGEMILVFENLSNDYDGDGSSRWVSGASHKQGTVFVGAVVGKGISILQQRCSSRRF